MHYVYILVSDTEGAFYTGSTSNLPQRIEAHNAGRVISTAARRPWKLAWYCAFPEKRSAKQFEAYLKSGSGHAFARKRLT